MNPLICPRCGSEMKVVAVLDNEDAIYKILRHLGLLAPPEESRAPPATGPPVTSSPTPQAPADLFASTELQAHEPFTAIPAWDLPEPPGPDFASESDPEPTERLDERDEGPDPETDDVA